MKTKKSENQKKIFWCVCLFPPIPERSDLVGTNFGNREIHLDHTLLLDISNSLM